MFSDFKGRGFQIQKSGVSKPDRVGDEDLMDEADVEHTGAKNLIAQLEAMTQDHSL